MDETESSHKGISDLDSVIQNTLLDFLYYQSCERFSQQIPHHRDKKRNGFIMSLGLKPSILGGDN